ncbi:MAG: hypothetical protein ACLP0J_06505 [Solirubrobacteraceae bacterium]
MKIADGYGALAMSVPVTGSARAAAGGGRAKSRLTSIAALRRLGERRGVVDG